MFLGNLFFRVLLLLAVSVLAYCLWRYFRARRSYDERQYTFLLVVVYVASRLGLWLVFATYLQRHVTSSDPQLYYTPLLEHFLAGDIPIRAFFYPYGPFLMPSMLPFYLLVGRSLAGISLFAIFAEAIAVGFLLKSMAILEQRGEIKRSWVNEALAVYLLNPATLYWTVFQGYHSIAQTAYSMAGLFLLVRGHYTAGYAVGLYGVAGTKLLAILDWPALMVVCRPRVPKLLWGTVPVLVTYLIFQILTGDVLFPLRYHIGYTSEGNIWYLKTAFGDLHSFYSTFPGNLLPLVFFGTSFLFGLVRWLRYLQLGLTSFSFQAAMGMTTFTMSLFFLFSLYTGNYYIPMLMLPASLVVTCPLLQSRHTVLLLLMISFLGIAGNSIWTSFGQPAAMIDALLSGSLNERLLTIFWIVSILLRIACFAKLAQLGLQVAIPTSLHSKIARSDAALKMVVARQ